MSEGQHPMTVEELEEYMTERRKKNFGGSPVGLRLTIDNAERAETDHCGFQMTFANGWTISVQWSELYNYCEKSDRAHRDESCSAECAAWNQDGKWLRLSDHDDVQGWMTPDEVAALIARVASL